MILKNNITCKNCNTENALYELICKNCKSYMRERIVNLDLWNILALLIENPSAAFKKIIQAEHKNFIVFLLFIIGLKILINVMFVSLVTINNSEAYYNFFLNYLYVTSAFILILFLYSIVLKYISKYFTLKIRIKDTLAITIYSLLPYVIGSLFFFPLELIVFGDSVFSLNPSPFILKPSFAYLLLVCESALLLWSVLLSVKAFIVLSNNTIYGMTAGIVLHILMFVQFYFSSIILFNI